MHSSFDWIFHSAQVVVNIIISIAVLDAICIVMVQGLVRNGFDVDFKGALLAWSDVEAKGLVVLPPALPLNFVDLGVTCDHKERSLAAPCDHIHEKGVTCDHGYLNENDVFAFWTSVPGGCTKQQGTLALSSNIHSYYFVRNPADCVVHPHCCSAHCLAFGAAGGDLPTYECSHQVTSTLMLTCMSFVDKHLGR